MVLHVNCSLKEGIWNVLGGGFWQWYVWCVWGFWLSNIWKVLCQKDGGLCFILTCTQTFTHNSNIVYLSGLQNPIQAY